MGPQKILPVILSAITPIDRLQRCIWEDCRFYDYFLVFIPQNLLSILF